MSSANAFLDKLPLLVRSDAVGITPPPRAHPGRGATARCWQWLKEQCVAPPGLPLLFSCSVAGECLGDLEILLKNIVIVTLSS